MNHLRIFKYIGALAVFAAMALMPSVANAQGPSGTYASGITCLNLTTAETDITVTFYQTTGVVANSISKPEPLEPNSPWLLFTPNIPNMPSGFLGSAVVSSGAETACSVNTQTTSPSAAAPSRVGTSQGQSADEAGTKLFATQIANNLGGTFDTYVAVQNVGGSEAEVKATYFDSDGAEKFTETVMVQANASKVFYQSEAQSALGDGFVGSATFESVDGTTPLAGTVALYNDGTSPQTAQFLSFNTFTEGASKVFIPRLVKNLSFVGYTSGWACQNIGPGPADMKMTVTMADQGNGDAIKTAVLEKTGVAEGQSWGGYMGGVGEATLDGIVAGLGSAVVESTGGTIACTINEDNRTGDLAGLGTTYGGVPDGQQSDTMSFPQITALGTNSFRGGFQYANTTGNATNCTHTYSNGDVTTKALAANASNSIFAPADLQNDKETFNGSVEVTCGEPIVGIYNLSKNADPGDTFAANNGINR